MKKIFHSIALRPLLERSLVNLFCVTIENYLATKSSSIRTYIYQMVGSTHYLFVVFNNNYCIS